TGVTTTVREFILKVFNQLGIEVEFKGKDVNEVGVVTKLLNSEACVKVGDTVVKIDPKYFRPTEVELLIGDPAKAKRELKWELTHNLDTLIEDMVKSDLELFKRDNYLREGGHQIFQYHE
ncbi:MAG: GDP-mannose 4,6-dehydratase, partial [Flammeovirgaceae bacterium]